MKIYFFVMFVFLQCSPNKLRQFISISKFDLSLLEKHQFLAKHHNLWCLTLRFIVRHNNLWCLTLSFLVRHHNLSCLTLRFIVRHHNLWCLILRFIVRHQCYGSQLDNFDRILTNSYMPLKMGMERQISYIRPLLLFSYL